MPQSAMFSCLDEAISKAASQYQLVCVDSRKFVVDPEAGSAKLISTSPLLVSSGLRGVMAKLHTANGNYISQSFPGCYPITLLLTDDADSVVLIEAGVPNPDLPHDPISGSTPWDSGHAYDLSLVDLSVGDVQELEGGSIAGICCMDTGRVYIGQAGRSVVSVYER